MSTARTKRREPKPVTAAELKETLRKAGLKSTAPRLAALRYLHSTSAPASHAELFAALESDGFDRATLYRNLVDLAEAGIVSRTDLGDHVWRFELRREGGGHSAEHPHFVCSDCGLVSCLPGVAVKIVSTSSAPRAVGKKNVEIQLRGRCDSCT